VDIVGLQSANEHSALHAPNYQVNWATPRTISKLDSATLLAPYSEPLPSCGSFCSSA
jgi:hypothetical protein